MYARLQRRDKMTNIIQIGDVFKAFARIDHPGKAHRNNPFVVTRILFLSSGPNCRKRSFMVHAGPYLFASKDWNFVVKETK